MFHFLKITKSKIKLSFFFLLISFPFIYLSIFLTSIIVRRAGLDHFQEQMNIFTRFWGILSSCIIPYILLVFLKKEFFLKKYFTEFTKVFFVLFISDELAAIIPILFYKIFPEIFLSNPVQITGFILKLIIFYITVCFIDKIDKEKVKI
ncbi:MAG: hypothetical protein ABIC82_04390 [bacterium]